MSEQELLQAGITALQSGDRQRASSIFAQLVKQYPRSERGWYMLGMSVTAIEQQKFCFQRVLTLNPNNAEAKRRLAALSAPEPAPPPPAWVNEPEPSSKSKSEPPQPAEFIREYEQEQIQKIEEARQEVFYPKLEPELPTQPKTQKPKKRKKDNRIIIITVIVGLCILALTAAIGIYMFTGSSPINQPTPFPTFTLTPFVPPTQTATSTQSPPTPLPTALPTLAYTPQFESAPCPFDAPRGVNVTCGYAVVPENRASNSGRTLRLAVAIFHSRSSNPAPDPVIFLQGGPGGAALQLSIDAYSVLVSPFLNDRDYITFDQRGTGFSQPSMNCDELDKIYKQDIYGTLAVDTKELAYKNAFLDCSGLLQAKGIDLTAYSTVESAADLRDIIQLLGYQKVNLYGASYGTRLAQVTMRDYPEIVRSAILDSVVPIEANTIDDYPASADSALSQLFNSCAADPDCQRAYPDLKDVFWELTKELDANPVTLSTSAYPLGTVTETVDGSYLLSVITGLIKTSSFIDTAPQTIYRVKGKDYSTLLAAQYSLPYAFDGISPGLYISMMCRENVLSSTKENLQNAEKQVGVKDHVFRPFYSDFGTMYDACKAWGAKGPDLGEKDAVVSDIPSLVIEGSFDPSTPPFFGKEVAANLPNSYYFEFPNMGHAPTVTDTSNCAMNTAVSFLQNPLVEPDRTCLNSIQPVKFLVPYTGDPPLELEKQTVFGVTSMFPKGWKLTRDGFFARNSSAFDITQVAALRVNASVQELVDYFSSSINGYRGLDGPPVPSASRETSKYSWTLYYATSNNRPVDIAAVEEGSRTLIVIMFSHPDEHDALYRTVFLPMVDSAK